MRILNGLLFFFFFSAMNSCTSPTSSIKLDIEKFKHDYPTHISTYQGKTRIMQYAWNGNPDKRPVIFVHGSPGSWEIWSHFLLRPELQNNYHLISIDRPGYGGSGNGQTEKSLDRQAEEIIDVLKLNHSHLPAILIGHSYGGPVIAKMAMKYPEKIAALIFVASSVSPDLEKKKWFQYPAEWWPISVLIPTELRVCNEEIMPLKNELTKMLPFWHSITAPVIVIQGETDDLVPKENVIFLTDHLKKESIFKIIEIPGLNHFVPWKRPDLIIDSLIEVTNAIK